MALTIDQTEMYLDRYSVYRPDQRDANASGDVLVMRPVRSLQNRPCKHFTTENYDERQSPAGQSKTNNIMTSDLARADFEDDVWPEDYVNMLAGPESEGWFTVAGAPIRRYTPGQSVTFTQFYLAPSVPLPISDSYWGE